MMFENEAIEASRCNELFCHPPVERGCLPVSLPDEPDAQHLVRRGSWHLNHFTAKHDGGDSARVADVL